MDFKIVKFSFLVWQKSKIITFHKPALKLINCLFPRLARPSHVIKPDCSVLYVRDIIKTNPSKALHILLCYPDQSWLVIINEVRVQLTEGGQP